MQVFTKIIPCLIAASFIFSNEGFAVKQKSDEEKRSLSTRRRIKPLSQQKERANVARLRHGKYRIKTTRMDAGLRNDLKTLGIKKRKYSLRPRELNNFMLGLQVVEDTLVDAPRKFRENHPVLTENDRLMLAKMEDRARAAQGITPRVRDALTKKRRVQR